MWVPRTDPHDETYDQKVHIGESAKLVPNGLNIVEKMLDWWGGRRKVKEMSELYIQRIK
jgi:hypothetical protein